MDDEPQATQGRQSAWTARKRHGGLIAAVSVVVAATVHGARDHLRRENEDMNIDGPVADDREGDRRNITWTNVDDDRRARVRRQLDRMHARRDEVERLCSADSGKMHQSATVEEILRIARREAQR